uniref:Phosphomevalonate kinase n=1 Tax=Hirondellea gigas TaxID=1518452 RepID=A0A2P2ICV3_9CRUS
MENPKVVFAFSGKRKCGKDFITDKFLNSLSDGVAVIMRLAGPIKKQYAIDHGLDYTKLLSTSSYKEKYRYDMIAWGEKVRNQTPTFFIDKEIETKNAGAFPVWVVSDVRRRSDLQVFRKRYGHRCISIRVQASEDTRRNRDWIFTPGVDDAPSECDLDEESSWDHVIDTTDSDDDTVQRLLETMRQTCRDKGVTL